ncbi:MAG: type II CAAX endopeptidase family protein [Chloroflexota bacterium]
MAQLQHVENQSFAHKIRPMSRLWKQRDIWQISILFVLIYLLGSLGLGVASTRLQSSPLFIFLVLAISAAAGIGSVLWVNGWRQQHNWQSLGFIPFSRRWFYAGTFLSIVFVVGRTLLLEQLPNVFPALEWGIDLLNDSLSFDTAAAAIYTGVGLVIVAPLWEELFFRGFIHNAIRNRMGMWGGILVSSLLFGLYHMVPLQIVGAFLLGLPLAWAYEKTGSLWLIIYMHALNNLLAFLYAYFIL